MFGMEEQNKGNTAQKLAPFRYELENEMADPEKRKALGERCTSIVNDLKSKLRDGLEAKEYENGMIVLSGYGALLKVVSKIKIKSKKH